MPSVRRHASTPSTNSSRWAWMRSRAIGACGPAGRWITRARSASRTTRGMAAFCERVNTSTAAPMRASSRASSRT